MSVMRRAVVDVAAVAAIVAVTLVGWWPTFADAAYLVAGVGALVIGVVIAVIGTRFRLGILSLAGLTVAAYFVLGGPLALAHTTIAGVIPSLETLRELALGAVTSWKSLLTTVAPVAYVDGHALVPFLLTLVVTVVAASLALRLSHPGWALIPLGVLLALQIAFGTFEAALPLLQGVVLAVVVIAWLALREAWAPARGRIAVAGDAAQVERGGARARLVAGAVVLALACGAGVGADALMTQADTREVIREHIVPPFDVHEYPSPLQAYRKYVRDAKEEALFTVAGGLPGDTRVRLAVMDDYDGVVYNVSDEGSTDTSAFTHLRTGMADDAEGDPVSIDVAVDAYADVWVPDTGHVDAISYHGSRSDELRRETYYNDDTGTAIASVGLREGDAYTVDAVLAEPPSDAALKDTPISRVDVPEPENVPEGIAEFAADTIADAETPIERVRALEAELSEHGFFSHGLEGEVYSLPGHSARRIQTLLEGEQMVGDDEQYAVAMALMAAEVGIPARVVMGFHDDAPSSDDEKDEGDKGDEDGAEEPQGSSDDFVATGDNLHAWVEVPFEGYGWLAFDPTPPEDQEPQQETEKPKPDPKPQVVQPPPPPQEPADLPPLIPDDEDDEEESSPLWGILGLILGIVGISLLVVILLMLPFVVIGLLKAARRRRRLHAAVPADRIAGGWEELMDRAADYGAAAPVGHTRWEEAVLVGGRLEEPRMRQLAVRADASVFGPGQPSVIEIDAYWKQIDEVVDALSEKASFWKRMRARVSVSSLVHGSALSARVRALRERVAALRKDG